MTPQGITAALRSAVAEREALHQQLLRVVTTESRDTYADGYFQGLAAGIDALDRALTDF